MFSQEAKTAEAKTAEAKTAEAKPSAGVVDIRYAHRCLTRQQVDAANNSVAMSKHTKITLMPNHSLNMEGELEGFVFECSADDSASVLPLSKSTFSTTAIYECRQDNGSTYQQLTMNVAGTKAKLNQIMHRIQSTQHEMDHLKLDCMTDMELHVSSPYFFKDQRSWCENTPAKVGIYHCFMRTTAQNTREHKIFIVVSGYCRHASEELYNMWLDARHDITVRQFVTCAELDWLRKATLRHHSRLAARVAQALNLNVDLIEDVNSVDGASMMLPSTSCVTRDIMLTGCDAVYTCSAAIMQSCKSGIIFDCFASEGFWIFTGPRDTGCFRLFGNEFQVSGKNIGFPTNTVRYNKFFPPCDQTNTVTIYARNKSENEQRNLQHNSTDSEVADSEVADSEDEMQQLVQQFVKAIDENTSNNVLYATKVTDIKAFMFPHAGFIDVLCKLGFNRNDGIINMMPIVTYCTDE